MILDRGHRTWAIGTLLLLAALTALYAWYAGRASGGPSGGSWWGLFFGILGTTFILFAAFLGVRKRRPHYRWGRAAFWLKGHLWLGSLSFPVICFHGGLEFGGPFTSTLMWVFVAVVATGVWGLALQQVLPRLMTKHVPQETVYEQIDHVRDQLFAEAEHLIRGEATPGSAVPRAKAAGAIQGRVVQGRASAPAEVEAKGTEREPLMRFLEQEMRPFFARRGVRNSPLMDAHRRGAILDDLRARIDPKLHGITADLDALCEQRAQLDRQRRLHLWMHGWLLVHVPLSWTMVVMTAAHAVMSLYY